MDWLIVPSDINVTRFSGYASCSTTVKALACLNFLLRAGDVGDHVRGREETNIPYKHPLHPDTP